MQLVPALVVPFYVNEREARGHLLQLVYLVASWMCLSVLWSQITMNLNEDFISHGVT